MSTEKYNVIVSDKAAKMLTDHVRFLANVSVDAAQKLRKEIISDLKKLEFMPEGFAWLTGEYIPANKYRKMVSSKRYLIIYQVKDNTVFVDAIVDCRQNYQWLL